MDRRKFMTAMAAAGGAVKGAPKLAADGGNPVRATPLRARHWGPLFYDEKERAQLTEVLDMGLPFRWYGPPDAKQAPMKVATFEKEFAERMQTRFALAVTSGTAALMCAVNAIGIGPGDEVIMPAWTWHSTCTAVIMAGGLPVFAEIDESFNLDPADFERKITPQTRLVMAVHLQGVPAEMDPILEIARKHKIKVLEDCAQTVGGSYKGKPLGSLGDIGIYSHQVNKTISSGEGGSVVTNDPVLFERACRFHDSGSMRPLHQDRIGQASVEPFAGVNFRMNEFTGGVMLAQIRKLDQVIKSSRAHTERIYAGIRDLPGIKFRKRPDPAGETGDSVYLEFDSKERRERFLEAMKAENVPGRPPGGSVILPIQSYVEKKVTAQKDWPTWTVGRGKTIKYGAGSCPRTIDILNRFGGVSVDPKFTKRDDEDVIAAIRKVYPAVMGAAS
ncbi:MAG: DegT/DnrJ/EryC1/StrS family aminotransferase [Bryobacteraceae bacterium]|nr:DegT/DnrJ/EryC1/StrS family aminotransferase [Bryobacteraceae bacterium]